MRVKSALSLAVALVLLGVPRVSFATAQEKAQAKIDSTLTALAECNALARKGERGSCDKELQAVRTAQDNAKKAWQNAIEDSACGSAQAVGSAQCKSTMSEIKNVGERNTATTITGTAAFGMASQVAAMKSSGSQVDAQKTTSSIMKGAAIVKLLEASSQGYGSAQLIESANKAESESTRLKRLLSSVKDCDATKEDCSATIKNAIKRDGVAQDDAAKVLSDAVDQTSEQAAAAKNAALLSGSQGAISGLLALQALQASKVATQNAARLAPGQVYNLNTGGASTSPSVNPGSDLPADFGAANMGGSLLGSGRVGGITDRPSSGFVGGGSAPSIAKQSTVSTGGGGGGAGSAGNGPAKPTRKGARSYRSNVGEFAGGGGGGLGYKGGSATGDQANPFADALAKLFGADGTADPTKVEGAAAQQRGLASEGQDEGSEVFALDVTLFEQVTTKYRQLRANGSI